MRAATSKSPTEKVAVIVGALQRQGAAKPRAVKTLTSMINSTFQKQLSEQEVASLLNALEKQGVVTVNGTKVSYTLPS